VCRCREGATVRWESHLRWLADTLERTDRVLLVCELQQHGKHFSAVGTVIHTRWTCTSEATCAWQARLDWLNASDIEISWTIAPE
jgi:hypothetical protein